MKRIYLSSGAAVWALMLTTVFIALVPVGCTGTPPPREKSMEEVVLKVIGQLEITEKHALFADLDGLPLLEYHEVLFRGPSGVPQKIGDALAEAARARGFSLSQIAVLEFLSDKMDEQARANLEAFDQASRALYCYACQLILEAKEASLQESKKRLQRSRPPKRIPYALDPIQEADQCLAIASMLHAYIRLCYGENDPTIATLLEEAAAGSVAAIKPAKARIRAELETALIDYWFSKPETKIDTERFFRQRSEDIVNLMLRGDFERAEKMTFFSLEKKSALGELSIEDAKVLERQREAVKSGELVLTARDKAMLRLLRIRCQRRPRNG